MSKDEERKYVNFLNKCVYKLFFRKLYIDGYVNVQQIIEAKDDISNFNLHSNQATEFNYIQGWKLFKEETFMLWRSEKPYKYSVGIKLYISAMDEMINFYNSVDSKKYKERIVEFHKVNTKVKEESSKLDELDKYTEDFNQKFDKLKDNAILFLLIQYLSIYFKDEHNDSLIEDILSYIEKYYDELVDLYKAEIKQKHDLESFNPELQIRKSNKLVIKEIAYIVFEKEIMIEFIESPQELQKSISNINGTDDGEVFYRGQSNVNYILEPSIYRRAKFFNGEHDTCQFAMKHNPEEFDLHTKIHLDILKKMQHYGYPTRLIDITDNLLMGLFFAIDGGDKNSDAEVIVFKVKRENVKYTRSDNVALLCSLAFLKTDTRNKAIKEANKRALIKGSEEYKIKKFNEAIPIRDLRYEVAYERPAFEPRILPESLRNDVFVKSTHDNRRISSQAGAFIACCLNPESEVKLNDYRLENKENKKDKKIIFIIPHDKKKAIKKTLETYGINSSVAYPEIEKGSEYFKNELI